MTQNNALKDIHFIYFDLDDTLLDHRRAETLGLQETVQQLAFLQQVDFETLREAYHRINRQLWDDYNHGRITKQQLKGLRFENTLTDLGLDAGKSWEFGEVYMEAYRKYWQWVQGAREAFDAIRDRYPVGIITNGFSETQHKKMQRFELESRVSQVVISEEVGYLKPDPRLFEHATRLAGQDPSRILYVGDSYSSDVVGGLQSGWKTAWFNRQGEQSSGENAHLVFDDFSVLSNMLNIYERNADN